jgi:large subunit ribosomal protein L15
MQLHELTPKHKLKKRKRVGRGGKRGTYSGKGIKGQKSRAGRKLAPIVRELIKKYPKLKGYRAKIRKENLAVVNVGILGERFGDSEVITPKLLLGRKIIRRIKGKVPKVKILGGGEINKKLTIENCEVSKNAKGKIEKAGGKITIQRTANSEQRTKKS